MSHSLLIFLAGVGIGCDPGTATSPAGPIASSDDDEGDDDDAEDDDSSDDDSDDDDDDQSPDDDDASESGDDDDPNATGGGGPKLDVGSDCEGDDCDDPPTTSCEELVHTPCDDGSTNIDNVLGLNCPDEPMVTVQTTGNAKAIGVRERFGSTDAWSPVEGAAYIALGSGEVDDLDVALGGLDEESFLACNRDLGSDVDVGTTLPSPLTTMGVDGACEDDPSLIGTGDCSNSIAEQFEQGGAANDYTEIRVTAKVPAGATSIGYSFAFFSTEYPVFFGSEFNDLFVGWLESESWTGNISFDETGNPISLNAGFLDYKDDAASLAEFAGTCMEGHAGTKWLSSTAPVSSGEEITLALAIFDLADSALDSYVFIDDIHFGCEGGPPSTEPEG